MLTEQFKLFAFMGIAMRLHISWLPFAALLLWVLYQHVFPFLVPELRQASYGAMAFAGLIVFFLSILFREMARVLAAHYLEIPMESVTLHGLGGIAKLAGTNAGGKNILILAAGGFLASSVLGALVAWLLFGQVNARMPLQIIGVGFLLILVNWALALINMIPAAMLAGWRYWSA